MSPTSRRRRGEPILDDAAVTVGTTVSDATDSVPDEPEWLREAAGGTNADSDPTAPPAPPPDPAVIAARRAAREAEIVRALNPEQARAVITTDGPAAHPGRRWIRQDAGPGAPDRLPRGGQGRRPVADPRGDLHQPRRRRTPRADHQPRRGGGRDVQAGTFHSLCARVLRQDGEAIGISRRFVIYDTDDQQSLMKQILREQDLPLTGEFRPSAVLGAISRAKNEMLDPAFLSENAANHRERTIARLATRYQERLQRASALDFDDLLLRPSASSRRHRRCSRSTRSAGATCTSTSTRTRTAPNTCGFAPSPRSTTTCASWATTTSRSTRGAVRTCATSSISSATGQRRPSSSSNATTARPS